MDRMAKILCGIDKTMLGIEVAPWFAPIASKATGYNVRILDVFDRDALLARAKVDPNLIHRDMGLLEDVDYVGSATEIASIIPQADLGTFDYIVSSHNFEHLPNPIKFLQGCAKVLKSGGVLSMAVPDRRGTFDYFRPNTQLGDWLDAYVADRNRPTQRQVFDLQSQRAYLSNAPEQAGAVIMGSSREIVNLSGDLEESYHQFYLEPDDSNYQDTHCTIMTPASLELLLSEIRYLGLVNFTIEDIKQTDRFEFYVQLRFSGPTPKPSAEEFQRERAKLLRRVLGDYVPQVAPGITARQIRQKLKPVTRSIRNFGRFLRGKPRK
jgi:SAM-dependent methyltransferase